MTILKLVILPSERGGDMITNSQAAMMTYDSTQLGYIRLQTAVNLLDYLSGLYEDETPEGTNWEPSRIRELVSDLEGELRQYVGRIAPDLLCPERKTRRGVGYLRPRQPFTGGRPKKPEGDSQTEPERRPPEGGAGGERRPQGALHSIL